VERELAGETEVVAKPHPSATLSTTNTAESDVKSNPRRRVGKPGTNRLSYSTTQAGALAWIRIGVLPNRSLKLHGISQLDQSEIDSELEQS
jgi:hypothetical protein